MNGFGQSLIPNTHKSASKNDVDISSRVVLPVASDEVEKAFQKKMGEVGVMQREMETIKIAQMHGTPYIDLEKFPISHAALRLIPVEQARLNEIVCFFASDTDVRVGALNPKNSSTANVVDQLHNRTSAHISVYMISQNSFDRVLELYKTMPTIKPVTKDISISEEDLKKVSNDVQDLQSLVVLLAHATASNALTLVLGAAFKLNASDIHLEAEETKVVVRFRLDGILHDAADLPKEVYTKLVGRIKLLASLKMNISSVPQDGRFTIKFQSGDVDVRVSTIPTVFGESIVLRLLHQSREGIDLDTLGLSHRDYAVLRAAIEKPNGMIVTTGPTGSGKTTTLYACMHLLNKPGVKIVTLEDPVEYRMDGINQSQIDHSKGYTFAKALRSVLRQDPDIAMVGEIRDLETAEVSVQAALTGHLILSTIHTNSAAGAIPRFLSMGVPSFLLAPALTCVMAQRLVRKLSPESKQIVTLTPEQQARVDALIASMPEDVRTEVQKRPQVFYSAPEYGPSGELGYRGRVGIYEVFEVTPELSQMILSPSVSEYDIERVAKKQGMLTMAQDGLIKALDGVTSLDEVFRVAG
jgi:type IV pilus assembly protein PilB